MNLNGVEENVMSAIPFVLAMNAITKVICKYFGAITNYQGYL